MINLHDQKHLRLNSVIVGRDVVLTEAQNKRGDFHQSTGRHGGFLFFLCRFAGQQTTFKLYYCPLLDWVWNGTVPPELHYILIIPLALLKIGQQSRRPRRLNSSAATLLPGKRFQVSASCSYLRQRKNTSCSNVSCTAQWTQLPVACLFMMFFIFTMFVCF